MYMQGTVYLLKLTSSELVIVILRITAYKYALCCLHLSYW